MMESVRVWVKYSEIIHRISELKGRVEIIYSPNIKEDSSKIIRVYLRRASGKYTIEDA